MIEVRIRHHDDDSAVHLGDVPLTEAGLSEALRLVRAWGIFTVQDGLETPDLSGQFVIDASGAYFEIIVGDDE